MHPLLFCLSICDIFVLLLRGWGARGKSKSNPTEEEEGWLGVDGPKH